MFAFYRPSFRPTKPADEARLTAVFRRAPTRRRSPFETDVKATSTKNCPKKKRGDRRGFLFFLRFLRFPLRTPRPFAARFPRRNRSTSAVASAALIDSKFLPFSPRRGRFPPKEKNGKRRRRRFPFFRFQTDACRPPILRNLPNDGQFAANGDSICSNSPPFPSSATVAAPFNVAASVDAGTKRTAPSNAAASAPPSLKRATLKFSDSTSRRSFSADAFASLLDPFELADFLASGDGRRPFQRRRVGRRRNEADGQVERRRERAPFAALPAFMFVRQFRRERFER